MVFYSKPPLSSFSAQPCYISVKCRKSGISLSGLKEIVSAVFRQVQNFFRIMCKAHPLQTPRRMAPRPIPQETRPTSRSVEPVVCTSSITRTRFPANVFTYRKRALLTLRRLSFVAATTCLRFYVSCFDNRLFSERNSRDFDMRFAISFEDEYGTCLPYLGTNVTTSNFPSVFEVIAFKTSFAAKSTTFRFVFVLHVANDVCRTVNINICGNNASERISFRQRDCLSP